MHVHAPFIAAAGPKFFGLWKRLYRATGHNGTLEKDPIFEGARKFCKWQASAKKKTHLCGPDVPRFFAAQPL